MGVFGVSKAGHGVDGRSATSFGVVGITTQNATSTTNARAGLLGEDRSSNKNRYNSGVSGTSTYGTGLTGLSRSGNGVAGRSVTGYGVAGSVTGAADGTAGVLGIDGSTNQSFENSGVAGVSSYGAGVTGTSSTFYGVVGTSDQEAGVYGYSSEGSAVFAVSYSPYFGGASTFNLSNGPGLVSFAKLGAIFIGTNGSDDDKVSIDNAGNEILAGNLQSDTSPLVRTHLSDGNAVMSFGERTAAPAIDDMGEAQLVYGSAYVPLEATFAKAVDKSSKYLVFVTAQGENRGLYVTNVTARGFAVRESGGGRSSLAFDYRIVAKPADMTAMRLPNVSTFAQLKRHRSLPTQMHRRSRGA